MHALDASVVIEEATVLIGWDPAQLEDRQKQMLRVAFSKALQEIWESWWWEALMQCRQFTGATLYTATTAFAVGAFCYFTATGGFYQCVQATSGGNDPEVLGLVDPAQYSDPQAWNYPSVTAGTNAYGLNVAYWARAGSPDQWRAWDNHGFPQSADYLVGVNDTGLPLGSIVRYPADGNFYQLYEYTGLETFTYQSTSTGAYAVAESFSQNGWLNGLPSYGGSLGNYLFYDPEQPAWVLSTAAYTSTLYGMGTIIFFGTTTWPTPQATPDLITTWTNGPLGVNGEYPPSVVAGAGGTYGKPSNAFNWCKLTHFTPHVHPPGHVRAVGLLDPRNTAASGWHAFEQTDDGWRLPGWHHGEPYVWYRRATPIITGDEFDPTVAYAQAQFITFPTD